MKDTKRTQAERRAATRRTLLDAAIELLMESGLSSCSVAAVADRAGMTTGALMYHFKTKAELIRAVISERIFAQDNLFDWDGILDLSVAERCKRLIVYQWGFYKNPKYLAMWDIILGARSDDIIQNEICEWQQSGARSLERLIAKVFRDHNLTPSDIQEIQYFMSGHLRGLALLRTVEDEPGIIKRQLEMLITLLTNHIQDQRQV